MKEKNNYFVRSYYYLSSYFDTCSGVFARESLAECLHLP